MKKCNICGSLNIVRRRHAGYEYFCRDCHEVFIPASQPTPPPPKEIINKQRNKSKS